MKLIATLTLLSVSGNMLAQDCSNYYYFQNDKTIVMSITNNKGKSAGRMTYKISNTNKTGNSVTATINSHFVDAKGETISKGTNNVKCENGVMQMDMKVFIPPAQTSGTATATDFYLEYPATMNVGDQLKDGHLSMESVSSGGLKSTVEIDVTDRKVVGKESVTTLAGTWECFKINARNKITTRLVGVGIPIKLDVTEYFAPGFGIVKTESKTGKTEITLIE